ncbi:hypothetical protein AB0I54_45180 [Streptomyces sp. NPDC050625]|uniref:hypothetical protein n=1 Tax=Streptomyces sp. NPDC050625 TaxID=3154629 RepID=UPI003419644E
MAILNADAGGAGQDGDVPIDTLITRSDHGGVPPMTVHLPVELETRLAEAARADGKTENDLIVDAVEQFLGFRHATADVPVPRFARRVGPLAPLTPCSDTRPKA